MKTMASLLHHQENMKTGPQHGDCYGWFGGTFKSRARAEEQSQSRGWLVVETKPGCFRISRHSLFWIEGRGWVDMAEGA
jgi:hypothetical protein